MNLALVIGAATPPGRLAAAVHWLGDEVRKAKTPASVSLLDLHATALDICDGRALDRYGAPTRQAVEIVTGANAVILTAPIYRASYPGVLKNLLDLLPVESLRDKPVGIVGMGGSPHHFLALDGQLRPVLAWFGALSTPNAVYLTGKDFADGKLASDQAKTDLTALAESCIALAAALQGRALGPVPLAARYTT